MNTLKHLLILFAILGLVNCGSKVATYKDEVVSVLDDKSDVHTSEQEDSLGRGIGNGTGKGGGRLSSGEGSGGGGTSQKSKQAVKDNVPLNQIDKVKSQSQITKRKIIRNANLQLEAGSPKETKDKIAKIAEAKNGQVFLATQSSSSSSSRPFNKVTMTIKVPSDNFDETIEEIRESASRVINEVIKGRDVTEEFIDIEARLKTQKALEERFLEIMKQSKSVADTLKVQRELARVRTVIERIEGRKRFLENQTSFSTIKIVIKPPIAISGSSTGFFYELKKTIGDGFEGAIAFVLFLVRFIITLLPFLIIVVLPVILLIRYFWKRYKKKRLAKKLVKQEINEEIQEE